jgi:competence protein ComEA
MTKSTKYWTLITILLIVIIVIGSLVIWSRYSRSQPIEISLSAPQELQGEIYIGGAVNNPGFYPLKVGDTVGDIIRAAGGTTAEAEISQLTLYIPRVDEEELPQKVDLNRAEVWLLQALPGIGEVRAQAIIDYRQQNGGFRLTNELNKVEGIGSTTYERIENLISVAN